MIYWFAYAIMPIGKKISVSMVIQKRKPLSLDHSGAFFLFLTVRHLQAGYRLLIAVQPFDDVVAGYTSRNSDNKRYQIIQGNTPPFLTGIGAVT